MSLVNPKFKPGDVVKIEGYPMMILGEINSTGLFSAYCKGGEETSNWGFNCWKAEPVDPLTAAMLIAQGYFTAADKSRRTSPVPSCVDHSPSSTDQGLSGSGSR
jgi:hypothetical protein